MGKIARKTVLQIFHKQLESVESKQQNQKEINNANVVETLAYGSDEKWENYDYIYPEHEECSQKLPMIINVHGGAFVSGDKLLNRQYAKWMAEQGYQVVVLNYNYVPGVNIMEQTLQVMRGAKYVIEKHCLMDGADMPKFYLTGDSSGTFIASLFACLWDLIVWHRKGEANGTGMTFDALPEVLKSNPVIVDYIDSGLTERVKLCGAGLSGAPCSYDLFPKLLYPLFLENRNMLFEGCEELLDVLVLRKLWSPTTAPIYIMTCEDDVFCKDGKQFAAWLSAHKYVYGFSCAPAEKGDKLYHCFNVIDPEHEKSRKMNEKMVKFFQTHA